MNAQSLEEVQVLFDAGASLAHRTENGTPVIVFAQNEDIARFCLEHGCQLEDCGTDKETLLHRAVRRGHTDLVRFLLQQGAHADARNNRNQNALYFVHDAHLAELLLAHGAQLNIRDLHELPELPDFPASHPYARHLSTPLLSLMHRKAKNRLDIMRVFLDHGADPCLADARGATPLHYAASPEEVQLLLSRGADISARTIGGVTPFLQAVECNHPKACTTLLELGADCRDCDGMRRSALHLACSAAMVRLLLAAGCRL